MSDAENMSRKEILQQNRLEKKLYAFADHAYRNKRIFISAAVSVVVIILGTWGGWKMLRVNVSIMQIFYTLLDQKSVTLLYLMKKG